MEKLSEDMPLMMNKLRAFANARSRQLDEKEAELKAREHKYEHDRRDLPEDQSRLDLREQILTANEEGTLKRLTNLLAAFETSNDATHAARSQRLGDAERELRRREDYMKD